MTSAAQETSEMCWQTDSALPKLLALLMVDLEVEVEGLVEIGGVFDLTGYEPRASNSFCNR